MDIIVRFPETTLRPQVGDYVKIYYIRKKLKDNRVVRKMLHIELSDSCELQLKKSTSGCIRLNINSKGQKFGFVEDYYVPNRFVKDIEDDDYVKVDVVFNGERWEVYRLQKESPES